MRHRQKAIVWPGHATPAEAVRYLASACDGAILRDGHGFSSDHVAYGHWLAGLPEEAWERDERDWALHLIRIYRQQLARAGYNPTAILQGHRPQNIRRRAAARIKPGWAPDPTGLHDWRWWNGVRWTSTTTSTTASGTRDRV